MTFAFPLVVVMMMMMMKKKKNLVSFSSQQLTIHMYM